MGKRNIFLVKLRLSSCEYRWTYFCFFFFFLLAGILGRKTEGAKKNKTLARLFSHSHLSRIFLPTQEEGSKVQRFKGYIEMADSELEAIRAKRLAELQAQHGGGGGGVS